MVAQNTSAQANQASTRAPVTSTQPQVAANGNPGEPIVQKPRREIDEAFRQLTDYHGDLPPKHELLFSFYISHLEHHRSQVAPVLHTQEQIADAFRQIAGVDRNPNMPYTGAIPPPAREGRLLTRFWQAHLEHHTRIAAAAAAAEEPSQQQQKQGGDSDDDGEPPAIRTAATLALGVGFGTTVTAILAHQQILFPKKVETGNDAKILQVGTAQNQNEGANAAQNQELVQKNDEVTKLKKEVTNLEQQVKTLKLNQIKPNSASVSCTKTHVEDNAYKTLQDKVTSLEGQLLKANSEKANLQTQPQNKATDPASGQDINTFLIEIETLVAPFLTEETREFMKEGHRQTSYYRYLSGEHVALPAKVQRFASTWSGPLEWTISDMEPNSQAITREGAKKLHFFHSGHQAGFEMAEALKQKVDQLKKKKSN